MEAGASSDSDGFFHPHSPRPARPIFSMLKIGVLNVEVNDVRVRDKNAFPYRLVSSSGGCQHADIAEGGFDERWEKYSALYFLKRSVEVKRRYGRGKFRSPMQRLAEG